MGLLTKRPIKLKKRIIVLWISAIVICMISGAYLLIRHLSTQNDEDFVKAVKDEALTANVIIMTVKKTSTEITYNPGLSGIIFKKERIDDERNLYYVLTAKHGIPTPLEDNAGLVVLGYNQPIYDEDSVSSVNMKQFYSRYVEATLEHYDPEYDLAVVSFESNHDYTALKFADAVPKRNQPVAALGNPSGERRNTITTGIVKTKKYVKFEDTSADTAVDFVFEHSAKTAPGSSGGAILNEDMEIVGIHIGVATNIFDKFVKGMAVPIDKVEVFLDDWEKIKADNATQSKQ